MIPPHPWRTVAAVVVSSAILAACGGSDPVPEPATALERDGLEVARASGCLSCHGAGGGGGVGPSWVGVAGSEVTLDDGTTVVADGAYLRLAITDPGAQKVAGYTIDMPQNTLTAEEVDAVVAYIEGLGR